MPKPASVTSQNSLDTTTLNSIPPMQRPYLNRLFRKKTVSGYRKTVQLSRSSRVGRDLLELEPNPHIRRKGRSGFSCLLIGGRDRAKAYRAGRESRAAAVQ